MGKTSPWSSQNEQSRFDPLIILPFDLWLEILEHILSNNPDLIFNLLFLSRAWNRTILQTPRLWKDLVLGDEEDATCKAYLFLALSSDLPVTVTIKSSAVEKEQIYSLLIEASHRILELRAPFYYSSSFINRSKSPAQHAFEKINSFKILETLASNGTCPYDVRPGRLGIPIDFTGAPRLRNVEQMPLHLETAEFSKSNCIESLSCCRSLESIHPLLSSFPRLRTLSLTYCAIGCKIFTNPRYEALNTSNYCLPRLDSILIKYINCSLLTPLLLASGSNLRHINVTISVRQFPPLISSLSVTPNLLSLSILLIGDKDLLRSIQSADQLPLFLLLKRFYIRFTMDNDKAEEMMAKELLLIFSGKLPSVEEITIDIPTSLPLFQLRELLSQCQPMSLTLRGQPFTSSHFRIELPSVKYLDLTQCEGVLEAIEAPNLEKLATTTLFSYPFPTTSLRNLVSLTLTLDMSIKPQELHFPVLERIIWNGLRQSSPFGHFSLPVVKSIEFSENNFMMPNGVAEDFCEILIRQPSRFPLLEEIALSCPPSWDILFLMLLRRNFNQHGYSRIKHLSLSLLPAPFILIFLTKVLAGKFSKISPLLEISFDGYLSMYLDPTM